MPLPYALAFARMSSGTTANGDAWLRIYGQTTLSLGSRSQNKLALTNGVPSSITTSRTAYSFSGAFGQKMDPNEIWTQRKSRPLREGDSHVRIEGSARRTS